MKPHDEPREETLEEIRERTAKEDCRKQGWWLFWVAVFFVVTGVVFRW